MRKESSSLKNSSRSFAAEAVCVSHIGRRENQEDNFLFDGRFLTPEMQKEMTDGNPVILAEAHPGNSCIYAVSDGMGGQNAGEVASRICVEELARLSQSGDSGDILGTLHTAISTISENIRQFGNTYPSCRGMGATLVLAYVSGMSATVLNVGDSRAYFYRDGTLRKITSDHSEGQRMLDLGLLSRSELSEFPARTFLNRYLGCGEEGFCLKADAYSQENEEGILMLCSDGISDFLSEDEMIEILYHADDLEEAGRKMVETAVAADNADNTTVILIPLKEENNATEQYHRPENNGLYSKGKAWFRRIWHSL